jgi:hypothetical protein
MKLSPRFVVLLVFGVIFLVLFLIAFGYLEKPDISGIFPGGKEMLVRYYACSLALCTKGCPNDENEDHVVNKICLETDITSKEYECEKWCYSYCDNPPSDWGASDLRGYGPGEICGKGYYIEVPLEQDVILKGCYEFDSARTVTEIQELIQYKKIEDLPGLDEIMSGWDDYQSTSTFITPHMRPGTILKTDTKDQYDSLVIDYGAAYGQIMLDPNEAYEIFGCVILKDMCQNYGVNSFTVCLFRTNLKIWTCYREWGDDLNGGYVFINSSTPEPATFKLKVEPCEGKYTCASDHPCERIRLGEDACFDVEVTNDLGTDSNFDLIISSCDLDGGSCEGILGCDLDDKCRESFDPNPVSVKRAENKTSTLEFKPNEKGEYTIWVTADPTAAYSLEAAVVKLQVVDFGVKLYGRDQTAKKCTEEPCKENEYGSWDVEIDNQFDFDEKFNLYSHCIGPGSCSCVFKPSSTVTVAKRTRPIVGDLECWSSTPGEYSVSVTAKSTTYPDMERDSNSWTLKVVKCFGNILLELDRSEVAFGQSFDARAYNLSDCNKERVWFAIDNTENTVGYCDDWDDAGSECTASIEVEDIDKFSLGSHTLYVLIELTGDNDYDDDGESASAGLIVYGFLADHIDIMKDGDLWTGSGCGGWGGGIGCYVMQSNDYAYIDPSWYGPDVTWMGYARVRGGECHWPIGNSIIQPMDIYFEIPGNVETNKVTINHDNIEYVIWDLGDISDAGYWRVKAIWDGECGDLLDSWGPEPIIYEAAIIPVQAIDGETIKTADHIEIIRKSWTPTSSSWTGSDEKNYIDPSWYGPDVTWMGYARVKNGYCQCFGFGSAHKTLHVRFRSGTDKTVEITPSANGDQYLIWDLEDATHTISDAGYWELEVYSAGSCGTGCWWSPEPIIYEAAIIPVQAIDGETIKTADHIEILREKEDTWLYDEKWMTIDWQRNYINQTWYGRASYKCYARANAAPCCGPLGCGFHKWSGDATLDIRFKNINTGETTIIKTTQSSPGPESIEWDCGELSTTGYWVVEIRSDRSTGSCSSPNYWGSADIYGATMIPIVTYSKNVE